MSETGLVSTASFIVLGTVLFVIWINRVENRMVKTLLDWFPAILFAYVIPAAVTHLFSIDFSKVLLHDLSKSVIIPFTILTVMSALSFKQLRIVGIKPIIVFGIGSLVIATLPVILVIVFGWLDESNNVIFLSNNYWKGLVPIVGGWIGGSTSQLVLKELAQTPESMFLSILVLDNIIVNVWTILMFQFIKKSDYFNDKWGINAEMPTVSAHRNESEVSQHVMNMVTIGAIVGVMIVISFIPMSFLLSIVTLSLLGLIMGNIIPVWNHRLVLKIAGFSIILIMAILGLKLNFSNLSLPWVLILLVLIWLVMHFMVMLFTARLLGTNIAWVAIGSMANLGGISTAPAVTAAYKKELMPHAIVLAILSMVTGTSWGMLTIFLFRLL